MESLDRERLELTRLAQAWTLQRPNLDLIEGLDQYPWFTHELQRLLKTEDQRGRLLLPNLRDNNETVAVYSDYGGESSDSKFITLSFLVTAWNQSDPFSERMAKIRELHGLNEPFKEIAFKGFRYGPLQRALDDYLSALSNLVNGFLLTVIIDKRIGSMFGDDASSARKFISSTLEGEGFGKWKPRIAEKLLIIVHIATYLVALLSREGQKVFWMTDHDSIAASPAHHEKTLAVFNQLLNHYSQHRFALVAGAVPFEERSPLHLDLLSAADIVAGSVEHYYTRRRQANGMEPRITEQSDKVLQWLSGDGIGLKRRVVLYKKTPDGVESSTVRFVQKNANPNAIYIPVVVHKT